MLILMVIGLTAGAAWAKVPAMGPDFGRGTTVQPANEPGDPSGERNLFSRVPDGKGYTPTADKAAPMGVLEAWVDDDFDNLTAGLGVTHFATIHEAVLAVDAYGTINVYPGAYNETAPNSSLYNATGPYTFGLFLARNGVTLQGVDADGTPIADRAAIAATVQCNPTNTFGLSCVFIEGSGVTVAGLEFFINPASVPNKTIEVIGDDCTVRHCRLSDGGSLYINDFRFDELTDTSLVQSYTIEGNHFTNGTSLDLCSGAGYSGPVSGRQVLGNTFERAGAYWNAISFNGSGTGVSWFVYGIGGAVIQGNSFSGATDSYIRVRGDYVNSQFDWESYFEDNTFDRAVVAGANPPADLREYSYTSGIYVFNHCRRIGTKIQNEITSAAAGDIVLAGPGVYAESLLITKPLTLLGGGVAVMDGATLAFDAVGVRIKSGDVTFDGFEIDGYQGNGIIVGYEASIPGNLQNVHLTNNVIHGIQPGYSHGFGIYVGYEAEGFTNGKLTSHLDYSGLVIADNEIYDTKCSGVVLQSITAATGTLQVANNHLHDIVTNDGIWIDAARKVNVIGNTSADNLWGVSISYLWYTEEDGLHGPKDILLSNNTITGNTDYGVGVYAGWPSTFVITGGTISGNPTIGIDNTLTGALDARNVDWGSPKGPLHPLLNAGGLGDLVSDQVLFTPWVGRTLNVIDVTVTPYGPLALDGTMAIGVDGDSAPGFAPGAIRAPAALPYTRYGFAPALLLGRPMVVGEIHSVTYYTKKATLHTVDAADWYFQFYTDPYVGGHATWYGDRVQTEPYFAENLTETAGTWTQWATAEGADNRLRFFDSSPPANYYGSYTDGFLDDLTSDPHYTAQPVMLMYLGVGSAWAASFDGLLDGVVVELISGETMSFNFVSGNGTVAVTPVTSGPINCSQSQTLTFSLTTTEGMPDVFGFNAVVRATGPVTWGTIAPLAPFGGTTQFLTADQGDGSYIISGTTVGNPTQPISGVGTTPLFTVQYLAAGTGTAAITFDSFMLRDPDNAPIPALATGASIVIDCTMPLPVTGITAAPAHNKVNVGWVHNGADTAVYEIYRGLWYDTTPGVSAYPEYDDLAGNVIPTRPANRAAAAASDEWTLAGTVPVGTLTFADGWANSASRGVYYYEVFAVDAVNNGSEAAALNKRATNYWLGDVHGDGPSDTTPNGLVDVLDMNALGAQYGSVVPLNAAFNALDVGRTDNWSRLGVPLTDSVINFEDLIVFAMNFGVVSAAKADAPVGTAVDLAWVRYEDGSMALRLVEGAGLKGLRVTADVPVGAVTAGTLLDQQSELTFLRNVGRTLDVSVAVMGVNTTFNGTGDLFVVAPGADIAPEDLTISARAIDNSLMELKVAGEIGGQVTPRVFALNAAFPNPFNPMTKISFSLPEAQPVRLAVYSLDGRKVATLLEETRAAGLHEIVWTGRDDAGQGVASGTYFYRLEAGPYSDVRKMTLMK